MQKADLPNNNAEEPNEEARQPLQTESGMSPPKSPHEQTKKRKHCITFAEGTQSTEISSSQNTCSYKDALSQPAPGLSHRQRLLWIQKRREAGLWAQCDDCARWRFLPHILDSHELPSKWYCKLNPAVKKNGRKKLHCFKGSKDIYEKNRSAADCSIPEASIKLRDEEDLIHSEYSAGSVVWARLPGWPWWPAMVDDCPDTEQFYWLDGFSDIPTHYNVVFFDAFEVTRAWIAPDHLKPYDSNKKTLQNVTKDRRYKKRLEVAMTQADDADMLPLSNRLNKYSFIARYNGNIGKPKKINKKDLLKFKEQLKRKFNIDFSDESDSESDGSTYSLNAPLIAKRQAMKRKNVIIVGTPKRTKRGSSKVPKKSGEGLIEVDATVGETNSPNKNKETTTEKKDNSGPPINHTNDYFKQPNSMTVQISSTLAFDTMNFDNDSSKTYVPDGETEPQTADISQTQSDVQELEVRIATPSSDDFDF